MIYQDYYKILGLPKTATAEEIKKKYRALALKFHPDKTKGDKALEERFKIISQAYDVLKNPNKKKVYDNLKKNEFENYANQAKKTPKKHQNNPRPNIHQEKTDPFIRKEKNFYDLFNNFFNDFFIEKEHDQKGVDLKYNLTISMEDAAIGCEKTIFYLRNVNNKTQSESLKVLIPPGVSAGHKIVYKSKGNKTFKDAKEGDLFVLINITKHPIFELRHPHIHIKLPLSLSQSILGTEILLPTLYKFVKIVIPKNSQHKNILRLKGLGFPETGGLTSGDMFIELDVKMPKNIDQKFMNYLKKIEEKDATTSEVTKFMAKLSKLKENRGKN